MKTLLRYLAEMKQLGIIADYAIGGATVLIYYSEPVQTQDIDVFVVLTKGGNALVNLGPIYGFLKDRGAKVENEYVIIKKTPVQFLVPYNLLVEEAVRSAIEVPFEEVMVRLPTLEYLMSIMVQTCRGKDKARLEDIIHRQDRYNPSEFERILKKFDLIEKWERVQKWIQEK